MASTGRRSRSLAIVLAASAAVAVLLGQCCVPAAFVVPMTWRNARSQTARAAYDSGKVNLGVEPQMEGVSLPDDPTVSCDQTCFEAISSCLEEGCSVEAMMKLDKQLAETEAQVQASIEEVQVLQKTAKVQGAPAKLMQLGEVMRRLGSLRGQLVAMKTVDGKEVGIIEKIMKAATLAFGGSRPGDYPKVGVSPYSE